MGEPEDDAFEQIGVEVIDMPVDETLAWRDGEPDGWRLPDSVEVAGETRPYLLGDDELWACALAVARAHGTDASRHCAGRMVELAQAGDARGVANWREILARLGELKQRQLQ